MHPPKLAKQSTLLPRRHHWDSLNCAPRLPPQPVFPLRFKTALCSRPSTFHRRRIIAACPATQILQRFRSLCSLPDISFTRIFHSNTSHTPHHSRSCFAVLLELSVLVSIFVAVYHHSPPFSSTKERYAQVCQTTYLAQLFFLVLQVSKRYYYKSPPSHR